MNKEKKDERATLTFIGTLYGAMIYADTKDKKTIERIVGYLTAKNTDELIDKEVDEALLDQAARKIFANELIEDFTLLAKSRKDITGAKEDILDVVVNWIKAKL